MASSSLEMGYGCDLDLIQAIRQYIDDCCHEESTDILNKEQNISNIPISEWNEEHCVSWVLSTCHERGLEAFCIDMGLLSTTSGMMLLQFSNQDFCQMMGDNLGSIFYHELQELKRKQIMNGKRGYSSNMIPKIDLEESYISPCIADDNYNSYTSVNNYYNVDQEIQNTNDEEPQELYDTYNLPNYTSLDSFSDADSYSSSYQESGDRSQETGDRRQNTNNMLQELYDTYKLPNCTFMDSYNDSDSNSSDGSPGLYSYEGSSSYQNFEANQNYGYYSSDESALNVIDDLENIDAKDLIRLDSYEVKMAYQDDTLDLSGPQNPLYHLTSDDCEGNRESHASEELMDSNSSELAKKNSLYHLTSDDCEGNRKSQTSEELMDSDSSELAKHSFEKVAVPSKRREREPKNWEFLIRLLDDPQSNPKLIRWEDKAKGTFLLVQPEIITQLWNSRTNKPPVSYHNFARGLRYHYKTGALFNISDRQLLYGCGPKAMEFLNKIKAKK